MSTDREAAIDAYHELSDLLTVLQAATDCEDLPIGAVAGVARLALKRANVLGGYINDLPKA